MVPAKSVNKLPYVINSCPFDWLIKNLSVLVILVTAIVGKIAVAVTPVKFAPLPVNEPVNEPDRKVVA